MDIKHVGADSDYGRLNQEYKGACEGLGEAYVAFRAARETLQRALLRRDALIERHRQFVAMMGGPVATAVDESAK